MPTDQNEQPRVERALDAALEVLGDQGVRALSHARIDRVAELPDGSTSNYFRTRKALLEGVAAHLALRERQDFGQSPPLRSRADAESAFLGMLEAQTGPHRTRTLARLALFVDLSDAAELAEPLHRNRRSFELWTTASLAAIGAPDPVGATTFLMATLDGAILHRLTVDPELEFEPIVGRALDACLTEH